MKPFEPTYFELANIVIQVLLLGGIGVTAVIYYKQLKAMQGQLRAARETTLRSLHQELLKLCISDPDLMEVWRASHADLSPEEFKRHLFVNLSLSHLKILFELGQLNRDQLVAEISHTAGNPHYRAFWARTRELRKRLADAGGDSSKEFYNICEEVFGGA